jgi:hypothetical protein
VRILISLFFLMITTSCSFRRVAMDYHEFFSARVASSFFDLDDAQSNIFRERWRVFSKKIAETKVDLLIKELDSVASFKESSQSIANLEGIFADVMTEGCADFAPVMVSFSPKQIEFFKRKLEERNKKFDPVKNGGLVKYRQSKQMEIFERINSWLGRVSSLQKDLVMKIDSQRDQESGGTWEKQYLAYSVEGQDRFMSIFMNHGGDVKKIEQDCKRFVREPESYLSESSKSFRLNLLKFRESFLKSMSESLEPDQQKHLSKELRKLSDDLTAWAGDVKK